MIVVKFTFMLVMLFFISSTAAQKLKLKTKSKSAKKSKKGGHGGGYYAPANATLFECWCSPESTISCDFV